MSTLITLFLLLMAVANASAQISGGNSSGGASIGTSTQLQVSTLGVNSTAPTTAGNVDLFPTNTGVTTHICLDDPIGVAPGFPAITFQTSCPGSGAAYALLGNANETDLNAPSGGTLHLNNNNNHLVNLTSNQLDMSGIPTVLFANLPACNAAGVGIYQRISNAPAGVAGMQACAGGGTNTSNAICGNTGAGTYGWKCY